MTHCYSVQNGCLSCKNHLKKSSIWINKLICCEQQNTIIGLLNFSTGDVLTTPNDNVFGSVKDVYKALLIHCTNVTRPKPQVSMIINMEDFCSLVWLSPVPAKTIWVESNVKKNEARSLLLMSPETFRMQKLHASRLLLHNGRATKANLTYTTWWQLLVVFTQDANIHIHHWKPTGGRSRWEQFSRHHDTNGISFLAVQGGRIVMKSQQDIVKPSCILYHSRLAEKNTVTQNSPSSEHLLTHSLLMPEHSWRCPVFAASFPYIMIPRNVLIWNIPYTKGRSGSENLTCTLLIIGAAKAAPPPPTLIIEAVSYFLKSGWLTWTNRAMKHRGSFTNLAFKTPWNKQPVKSFKAPALLSSYIILQNPSRIKLAKWGQFYCNMINIW